jgi:3-hydroxybutyrate dehydrogenase
MSFDEAQREFVAEKQPLARYTRPEDIGALAVFLAGDAAATITGSSYPIDGGWTAH